MPAFEAELLKGFASLSFGASNTEAIKLFGNAEANEEMEAIDGSKSAIWHYWSKGFTLFFDGPQTNRFCCAEIDKSVELKLFNKTIFSLSPDQLKKLLVENGFKELEEEMHEWGEKRITFDDAMADFYFVNETLVSVNYSASKSL